MGLDVPDTPDDDALLTLEGFAVALSLQSLHGSGAMLHQVRRGVVSGYRPGFSVDCTLVLLVRNVKSHRVYQGS